MDDAATAKHRYVFHVGNNGYADRSWRIIIVIIILIVIIMVCYVMLCYVMLYYVMLCYVMLCYVYTHIHISIILTATRTGPGACSRWAAPFCCWRTAGRSGTHYPKYDDDDVCAELFLSRQQRNFRSYFP